MYKKQKLLVLLSSAWLFLAGCGSISYKDQTPAEMPYVVVRDFLPFDQYILTDTPEFIGELVYEPGHRFLVEVKPRNVTTIDVDVVVNNVFYPMTQVDGGLWTSIVPFQCTEEYEYYYSIYFSGFGNPGKVVISDIYTTEITGWGNVIWYSPPGYVDMAPYLKDKLMLSPDTSILPGIPEAFIVIQNLTNEPVVLYGIQISDDIVGVTHNEEFSLDGVPANASGPPVPPADWVTLECGEALVFRVIWDATTDGAVGALRMLAHNTNLDIVFNEVLWLTGDLEYDAQ